jgi:hypothetical protein
VSQKPEQYPQGGEGVEDVPDHEFAPVLYAYQTIGGVKTFYFFNIAGKTGGNPVNPAVKKAGCTGILPPYLFKAPE